MPRMIYRKAMLGRRLHSKKIMSLLALAVLVIVAGTITILLQYRTVANPFPPKLNSETTVSLYYPNELPHGFRIDSSSITQPATNVITFSIKSENSTIYASEETAPSGLNFKSFYSNFSNVSIFSTTVGKAIAGLANNGSEHVASVVTGATNTWIILNSSTSVQAADLQYVLQHLTLSH